MRCPIPSLCLVARFASFTMPAGDDMLVPKGGWRMNSVKVGNFMKALRKEKGLTQEQLAQAFRVSRRTVSRWETGSNLPDMEILIEMADFYDVDLR